MKNKKIFPILILLIFMYSKLFYFSLITIGNFNFTLSDLSLLIMIGLVINTIKYIPKTYLIITVLSLLILVFFTFGSFLQSTDQLDGAINFVKRWLSLIIIPIYMYFNIKKENIKYITYYLSLLIILFAILNWDNLVNSIGNDRFTEGYNPNVIGILMSLIFIFFLHVKKDISVFMKYLIYIICFIFIIAVSSRGALIALLPVFIIFLILKFRNIKFQKIFKTVLLIPILIIFIPSIFQLVKQIFPYSYERIYNTFNQGILNDMSALSRLGTQEEVVSILFSSKGLFFFGTGFGNSNMYNAFNNLGIYINTTDNMYTNILAWSGVCGFICFLSIILLLIFRIYKMNKNPFRQALLLITIFLLLAGIAIDTLTEPTIGAFYFIFLGIFEVYNFKRVGEHAEKDVNIQRY